MKAKIPYKAPEFQEPAFNCPFCNAYANQQWNSGHYHDGGYKNLSDLEICFCGCCGRYSIWHDEKMIYPDFSGIEPPNQDLNIEIQKDYEEAATILQKSPRGAAALLRLAIQKLCYQLGEKGKIDDMIGSLVKKGLPEKIQKALDLVRVVGNDAVHPGELDLKDDVETASKLFILVNLIAEKLITEPREVDELFNSKVSKNKKKSIEERDNK